MKLVTLLRVACILLFAPVVSAQDPPPVAYNPPTGTQDTPNPVDPSSQIKVYNDIDVPIVVVPRASDGPPETGTPIGDPFIVLANSSTVFTVPNTPALLGMPFELDPNAPEDQLLGH
jgi:hypothetical protein